jgi:hypothetical protein
METAAESLVALNTPFRVISKNGIMLLSNAINVFPGRSGVLKLWPSEGIALAVA